MINGYEDVLDLIIDGVQHVSREDLKKIMVIFDMGISPSRVTLLTSKFNPDKTTGVTVSFCNSEYMFAIKED